MSEENDKQSFDHSSHKEFYDYYAEQSVTPETMQRLIGIKDSVIGFLMANESTKDLKDVADIGCGAGTLALLWAKEGYNVKGLDVNEPLVELARKRSEEAGLSAEFFVGSATELPWEDASVDICIVPELLEHVPDWEACLNEFIRVLRPGGIIYLTTTNKLCPKQYEYKLFGYSWYPAPLKRRYERLAVTTRPEIVGYATYPAVNWFSFYSLRDALAKRHFSAWDRFDIMRLTKGNVLVQLVTNLIRLLPPLRFVAQVLTPYTVLIAQKKAD
jgi:ubiquinone/menaquinone biosynthesis C-methylase UbiE